MSIYSALHLDVWSLDCSQMLNAPHEQYESRCKIRNAWSATQILDNGQHESCLLSVYASRKNMLHAEVLLVRTSGIQRMRTPRHYVSGIESL